MSKASTEAKARVFCFYTYQTFDETFSWTDNAITY